ncbi:hypothetical protein SAMN02745157_4127 [Kaistia soli DSM 19436]|uniref:Peptidase propeptide and YPEB domain-containing protein n=1 Tax=Kaistia soli DSM 19436 TaxID=1122133 RepID=A0A1M5J8D7_9HYPH|nr:hypothetical protein [Kaistia soli]SHG36500.1 hypothetical protein SAMN02745157_4127 [Kaistia soli DSM 19436]
MFKALLASSLVVSALTLPAVAGDLDYRPVGGGTYGYQEAGESGWRGDDGGFFPPPPPPGRFGPPPVYAPAPDWRMPPGQLVRTLRHRGYYDVQIIRERRDVTIVRAGARGQDVILVVDARSGDVLRQRPADDWGQGRGWGQDWRRW